MKSGDEVPQPSLPSYDNTSSRPAIISVCIFATVSILALIGIGLYTRPFGFVNSPINFVGILVGLAIGFVGGFFGFLFGIPLTRQLPGTSMVQAQGGELDGSRVERRSTRWDYRPNDNLEQVSDWLTKIIVGIGLTQIEDAPERLVALANYLAPVLGGTEEIGERLAVGAILFFLISGFMVGYLWSRLFLPGGLRRADQPS